MPKPKHASSYSLTPDAKSLLQQIADSMGIARNAVLEVLIRKEAERRKLSPKKLKQTA
jgi:hypothetical protein